MCSVAQTHYSITYTMISEGHAHYNIIQLNYTIISEGPRRCDVRGGVRWPVGFREDLAMIIVVVVVVITIVLMIVIILIIISIMIVVVVVVVVVVVETMTQHAPEPEGSTGLRPGVIRRAGTLCGRCCRSGRGRVAWADGSAGSGVA